MSLLHIIPYYAPAFALVARIINIGQENTKFYPSTFCACFNLKNPYKNFTIE